MSLAFKVRFHKLSLELFLIFLSCILSLDQRLSFCPWLKPKKYTGVYICEFIWGMIFYPDVSSPSGVITVSPPRSFQPCFSYWSTVVEFQQHRQTVCMYCKRMCALYIKGEIVLFLESRCLPPLSRLAPGQARIGRWVRRPFDELQCYRSSGALYILPLSYD